MNETDPRRSDTSTSIGILILRVGFGGYLMTHGWSKLQLILQGRMDAFADPIGLGVPASLILVTFAEFFCALLVLIGLATRAAAIPVVVAMAVAAFVAHGSDPWTATEAAIRFMSGQSKSWASKQPALMFLLAFLTLIFTGAGRFSLDHLIARRRGKGTREASGSNVDVR